MTISENNVKRKRGRPKGAKNKPKNTENIENSGIKRSRGRPKGMKHSAETRLKMSLAKKSKIVKIDKIEKKSENCKLGRRRDYNKMLKIVPRKKDDPVLEINVNKQINFGKIDIEKYVKKNGKIVL